MKDVYGDLNDFDKRLKGTGGGDPYGSGSDDEPQLDSLAAQKKRADPIY